MDVIQTFCCCDRRKKSVWKATGISIGWLSLITSTWLIYEVLLTPANQSTIVSIIYIILVLFLNVKEHICKYVTIFLCVLNWFNCWLWLLGVTKNVKECMLASLLWWGVEIGFFLVSFGIITLFFGLYKTLFNVSTWEFEHVCLVFSSGISSSADDCNRARSFTYIIHGEDRTRLKLSALGLTPFVSFFHSATIFPVLFVTFYVIAFICFKSLKQTTYKMPGSHLNISYSPTSKKEESQAEEIFYV